MSRKKPESKQISQEWLTTYSDMMTLILTFFVLLYSFSLLDKDKFRQLAQSLALALGGNVQVVTNGGNIGPVPVNQNPGEKNQNDSNISIQEVQAQKMYDDVLKYVQENELQAKVSIKKETRGIIIELQDNILFDSGSA
jgi:chemotaxis protein MotB